VNGQSPHPRIYDVSARGKESLYRFIRDALEEKGASILYASPRNEAPFRVTFELPNGERAGVAVYAFFANSKLTKNRPSDEHRFQVKYGSKDGQYHELWQDPYGLYTTLFCGIDPDRGIFVGADPVLHNPTRFFISLEYKNSHVENVQRTGWSAWERERRQSDEPIEVLVGGTRNNFLKYIQFERAAAGESPGHRHLLAEQHPAYEEIQGFGLRIIPEVPKARLHALTKEFALSESEVLDLISNARRLKMAVRGWVAEEHLTRLLSGLPGVSDCRRRDEEGGPDVSLFYEKTPLTVECKNVLRVTDAIGRARVDFQRTRASKTDPCSRFYAQSDFDVLAACLNAVENKWNYRFLPTYRLEKHAVCPGKLSHRVKVDERWALDACVALSEAAKVKR
jgi:hypothetical protein